MSRKKKIIILGCSLLALYYLIGFPLTLFGVVNKWHLFPGGITLQFAGNKTHPYENEIVIPDSDGPYILYRNDSIYVTTIRVRDSVQIPETQAYPESERSNITIACTFAKNPEWNFKTTLKESLLNEHTYFSGVKKIVAISDIEGNFERFRELLLISGVIDSAYNWAFDDGHLVLVGDFFDRGLNVTECLWLIYNLETKAAQAGGYVHFILGNHEIMNMSYDFRYVRKKYIENANLMSHEYKLLYKPGTELGNWLATKNIVEKINDIVFTHGGISDAVASQKIALDKMNTLARPCYFLTKEELPTNDTVQLLFDSQNSPFWNRDYVNQTADSDLLNQVLTTNQSKVMVVGHTIVNTIQSFYEGRVIGIDTDHATDNSQALIINNGSYSAIDKKGVMTKITPN